MWGDRGVRGVPWMVLIYGENELNEVWPLDLRWEGASSLTILKGNLAYCL